MSQFVEPCVLSAILSDTLQVAAFQYAGPSTVRCLARDQCHLRGAIGFSGFVVGEMSFIAPQSYATVLAASMLGISEEDPQAEVRGKLAMAELANMLAGRLFDRWPAEKIELSSELPTTYRHPAGDLQFGDLADGTEVFLETDEGDTLSLRVAIHASLQRVS